MKFERLTIPSWELPDLVAFNRRVHEWIDPWWERKWIRRLSWAALAVFVLGAGMWLYFATGLPSSEKLLAYEPPLPTNVRGYDGDPVQTFARERRAAIPYVVLTPEGVPQFTSVADNAFFPRPRTAYTGPICPGVD